MKGFINFFKAFLKRDGDYVFFATIISRLLSFTSSWIALQFIPKKELGVVLFAFNIVLFIIPFGGFGLHQSLVRYGALLKTIEEKNELFSYVFKNGFIVTFILTVLLIIVSRFITFEFDNTNTYLILFSFVLIPSFLLEITKIQFRLLHKNKVHSQIEITYTFILTLTVLLLSYFYKENGYIAAIIVSPLLTFFLFYKKIGVSLSKQTTLKWISLSFWKYGFYSGLTNIVTNFLFLIDIFLIGFILKNAELVTIYKYITLIPFSFLFLSRVLITTDFVSFTEKIHQKKYIFNYIKNYMLLFTSISLALLLFFYFFSKETLLIFDTSFTKHASSFYILIIGVCGILIFRGLFGNLLSSIGKIKTNYYIILIAIILNIVSNYYLIPKYEIKGAAITSAILMWFTGIASCLSFLYYYKKNENYAKTS